MTEPTPLNPFAAPILERDFDYRLTQERDPTPRYSASGLGFCITQLYYKVQGVHQIENRDLESDCRMAVGNAIHEVLQTRVKLRHPDAIMELQTPDIQIDPQEVRDEIGEEPCFTEPVFCSGRPDIYIPCPYDPDLDFVVEIKTGTKGLLSGLMPDYHAVQGAAYWRSLDVDWVYFYQVDRGTIARRFMHFPNPHELWKDVLRIVNRVERHINELGTPPPAPAHISKVRHCLNCGYFYKCFPEG